LIIFLLPLAPRKSLASGVDIHELHHESTLSELIPFDFLCGLGGSAQADYFHSGDYIWRGDGGETARSLARQLICRQRSSSSSACIQTYIRR
jgi:hypothetical protein